MKTFIGLLVVCLSISSYGDAIKIGAKTLDGVYVRDTSSAYIVMNPADGTLQTLSKKRMDVKLVKTSENREVLLKEWEARQKEPSKAFSEAQPNETAETHKGTAQATLSANQYSNPSVLSEIRTRDRTIDENRKTFRAREAEEASKLAAERAARANEARAARAWVDAQTVYIPPPPAVANRVRLVNPIGGQNVYYRDSNGGSANGYVPSWGGEFWPGVHIP